jgi:hypothetical protein
MGVLNAMKAFIVTVITPNDWSVPDIVISMNMGMKKHAEVQNKDLSGIFHSVTVSESFDLKRQDI